MGRSFDSIRMETKETAERWRRAARSMNRTDRPHAERLAAMAQKHASEGFYAFDDPLESAVYSVLVEILKELDHVDP